MAQSIQIPRGLWMVKKAIKQSTNSSTVVGQIRVKQRLDAAALVLDTCPSGVRCTRERVSAVRVRRGRVEVVRVNYGN